MAKDRKKLQHIHSSIPDKQPTPLTLEVGEIAVNNAKDQEFLSIKNSDDKVVRFSSDAQMIEWMERKEVMPYEGQVRGAVGPTGTKDSMGSYGITNDDLLNNKSNLIIKNNQVAAENTVKHNIVNGAKDIYNKEVNPTSDSGVTDGAGFAIDMSRYAMIGANPSFSSITVTDKTDLSGNTTITDGDGTGTRIGKTLTIKMTNENETITTLNESATTRTTKIGTENLNVSGTTTEVKVGNVTESHSGTTTENKKGDVVENNLANFTANTTGNVVENTTGTTTIMKNGVVSEDNKNNVIRTTSGTTSETFKGQVTENNQSGYTVNTTGNVAVNTTGTTTEVKVGNVTESHSGTTTENKKGDVTENNLANKVENTTGTHKIYTTGDTCVNSQANANFYGNGSTNIGVACDGTTKGSATTVYGTTTTISGNTTNLTGATTLNISGNTINKKSLTANTNTTSAYTSATTATTVIGTSNASATTATLSGNTLDITEATSTTFKSPATTVSGTSLTIDEGTSISAKTPTTNLSGTTLGIVETNTDIQSCGRISGKTNAYSIEECAAGGTYTEKFNTSTISGTNLNVTEGTSTINSTNTNLTGTNLTIKESATTLSSTTTTISGGTLTQTTTANTTVNVGGALDENVTGATTINRTGAVTENNKGGLTITTTGKTCMQSTTDVNIGGDANTNVGAACNGGVYSNNTSINASSTVNVNAPTTNITGNTNISGNTTIGGDLIIPIPCTGITSTTVNGALCEVLGRDTITMTKTTPAATSEILATYKLFQNGIQIGEDINIPKDHLLKDVSIVYGKASGSAFTACTSTESDCHWYIKLVWNVYDPSTGHADDKTTYLLADDFIKDIDDKNPSGVAADSSYNNVAVNVWYDGKQNLVSATTTPTIHAKENIYADGNISGTNITASTAIRANNVSANTISAATGMYAPSISGTNITAATAVRANNVSANTLTAATSVTTKDLAATGNETVGGTLNVSGAGTINGVLTIPSGISKKLTWTSGTFTADTTGYNGSADKVITIPTSTAHLTKSTLTIDYNADVRSKSDTSYNTEAAATVSIPGSLDHLSNYDGTNINIGHPTNINGNVNVTGTVTASGAIYSSDKKLKENIQFVKREDINKVKNIFAKSYNFITDENKAKVFGVIAQDVIDAGLPELVHTTDDEGTLGVDYTSLLILKIAYLEDFCAMLNGKVSQLEEKLAKFENKD